MAHAFMTSIDRRAAVFGGGTVILGLAGCTILPDGVYFGSADTDRFSTSTGEVLTIRTQSGQTSGGDEFHDYVIENQQGVIVERGRIGEGRRRPGPLFRRYRRIAVNRLGISPPKDQNTLVRSPESSAAGGDN